MAKGKAPGSPKTGGRVAGTPNKVNKALKDMILGALDDVDGQKYLAKQAIGNPVAFMSLLGRVLPTTLAGTVDVNAKITEIKRTIVDPKDNVLT
jgi:hypothetical protein